MHTIYVRALVKAFYAAMEHWGRSEPVPPRYREVFAWVDARDRTARSEAVQVVDVAAGREG